MVGLEEKTEKISGNMWDKVVSGVARTATIAGIAALSLGSIGCNGNSYSGRTYSDLENNIIFYDSNANGRFDSRDLIYFSSVPIDRDKEVDVIEALTAGHYDSDVLRDGLVYARHNDGAIHANQTNTRLQGVFPIELDQVNSIIDEMRNRPIEEARNRSYESAKDLQGLSDTQIDRQGRRY